MVQPSYFFSLFCLWVCTMLMLLGSVQRAEQLGFRLVQCLLTHSCWNFWDKKKRELKPPQLLTPDLGMCHMALWQTLKSVFCFLSFPLQ